MTGVAVNLATEWRTNPPAWVAVVLLTALGVVVATRVRPPSERSSAPTTSSVRNSISGTVHGPVVQAGHIGSYTDNTDNSVHQTAVAHENSTVHQATEPAVDRGVHVGCGPCNGGVDSIICLAAGAAAS
jgi:hypothetical protein